MAPIPDRYQVRETLLENDEQVLQRASDSLLEREVLLKCPGPSRQQRFAVDDQKTLREARALARVSSPHVQKLHEVLESDAGPILVLEALAASRLAEQLEANGPLEQEALMRLTRGLCDALDAIHREGIVHRGLSSESVLLRADGEPVLAGFDFAKAGGGGALSSIDYGANVERSARPEYPAPEQRAGQSADARSDLYGLGHVLYEAATGKRSSGESLSKDDVAELPAKLRPILLKLTAQSPLGRYPNARELREAIEDKTPQVVVARSGSRTGLWGAAAALAAALVAGIWLFGTDQGAGAVKQLFDERAAPTRGFTLSEIEPLPDLTGGYSASKALVIGVPQTQSGHDKIPNAKKDSDELVAALRALDWQVTPLIGEEATRKNILAAIEEIRGGLKKNDQFLFYFAGHGEPRPGDEKNRGWILPADAQPKDTDKGRSSWIDFNAISVMLGPSFRAKHVLVVLDCCYSGIAAGFDEAPLRSGTPREYHRKFLQRRSRAVLTSTLDNQAASDGKKGENSPFAKILLESLRRVHTTQTPLLLTVLYGKLREDMPHDYQIPALRCHDRLDSKNGHGEFMFLPKP
jgi:serine/threonine protein kinase